MQKSFDGEDENARIRRLRDMDKSSLPPDGGDAFNRLIFSRSPYLLQHAENPVDWHPWGEEAFDRARREDKPVFLSIGYAACHWCHVMAHESFEDGEVAGLLNRHYISVKVDREERPDVDDQYMTAAQLMNVNGGWPLTVVMTPDRRPFFIATYLPRHSKFGMSGVMEMLEKIAQLWRNRRGEIERRGAAVLEALSAVASRGETETPAGNLLGKAFQVLRGMYDKTRGGFGSAPKFPMPLYLSFLLLYAARTGSEEALGMAGHTLRMMRRGGICDQIGYGFHRYSVDEKWLAPHFEKMLYDQALLALVYLEAFQFTGEEFFRNAALEIFAFVEREMTAPEGGFYSALDADSEGKEGAYYLWTPAEIEEAAGKESARQLCRLFGVTERGNFEGKNILFLPQAVEEFAAREGIPAGKLAEELEKLLPLLMRAREKRIRPLRDEKILTSWNGLMIAALARSYAVTGEERYRASAVRALSFIRENMITAEGRLLRTGSRDKGGVPGFLEDYAFLCRGTIELHQATLDPVYLEYALRDAKEMLRLFRDAGNGGFFDSGSDAETALVRMKGGIDGVIPSGNAAAAMNLIKLGRITGDEELLGEGEAVIRSFMGSVNLQPSGHLGLLAAFDCLSRPPVEVVLASGEKGAGKAMLHAVARRFIPGLVLRAAGGDEEYRAVDGLDTVYLCAAGACRPPVTEAGRLDALLDRDCKSLRGAI